MTTITNTTTNDQLDQATMPTEVQATGVLEQQRTPADEQPTDVVEEQCTPAGEQVMDLLEGHVPLSLIMDLTAPTGPDSQEILATEGKPDASWWLAH